MNPPNAGAAAPAPPPGPSFGEFVGLLRAQRGLTQDELARRVGVDRNTIARTEQDKGIWYRRISRAIFEALGSALPLKPDEAERFLMATDLAPGLARPPYVEQSTIRKHIAAEDAGEPVPNDPTSREMREVHRAFSRLLEALGPAAATKVMDAVADAQHPAPTRQPPRQLTVVEPPKVPFPGAVEQVHRTYEVPTPKPKARATRKKRTG